MNDVPHLDLKRQHQALRSEILSALAGIVDDTAFVGGPRLTSFEADFARFCGVEHCVGVANGTDAIKLCLKALGVGPGDEVLVPAFTFVATAGAVFDVGAKPLLVDVDERTSLLSPEDSARKTTGRTKAALLVHLYGLAGDPEPIAQALASSSQGGQPVTIVEDCAQSHGASVRGVKTGALTDIAAFSFYPTKNLGAMGDGGAVTSKRKELADAVRMISDHGRPLDAKRRGEHDIPGFNSRLDTLQASVLSIKLRHLADWNARRAQVAAAYDEVLRARGDVKLQHLGEATTHSYYLYPMRHAKRDALAASLASRGIQARAVYPHALHQYPALKSTGARPGDFPVAESWGREVLTLPMFPEITDAEVERVLAALPAALDEAAKA